MAMVRAEGGGKSQRLWHGQIAIVKVAGRLQERHGFW